ncbi:hydrogenase 4 subunit F, partial [mine drainage metagenome]
GSPDRACPGHAGNVLCGFFQYFPDLPDRFRRADNSDLFRPLHENRGTKRQGHTQDPEALPQRVPDLSLYNAIGLFSNNLGILWVSIEGATLATVLLVSLYRTRASIEAAWKYFILCGVGISQALFGTILLYFAAEKILGPGGGALLWTHLFQIRFQLEPTVLKIAFV